MAAGGSFNSLLCGSGECGCCTHFPSPVPLPAPTPRPTTSAPTVSPAPSVAPAATHAPSTATCEVATLAEKAICYELGGSCYATEV